MYAISQNVFIRHIYHSELHLKFFCTVPVHLKETIGCYIATMFFAHIGKYMLMITGMFSSPERFQVYSRELFQQCVEIGWRSVGIVILISFFIGAVTVVQTSYQLVSPLIPPAAIAQIAREAILLEFAPTLISIVLAGVVGSKITSELGNMRVTEQIDALETIGVNSKAWLILPKVIAALIMVPSLTIISAALGVIGGRFTATSLGIVPGNIYDEGLLRDFKSFTLIFMLIKSYFFAFLISSISCYFGYYVDGGALGIGRATTRAVITTCISILLADYLLSLLLLN